MLARHQVHQLAPLIEQTREDLGTLAESRKLLNARPGLGRAAQAKGEAVHRVLYGDLSGGKADWMPPLLASLGIEAIAHDIGAGELPGGMLVNCLNADPRNMVAAVRREDWKKPLPLFLIAKRLP